eukprot:367082_1
MSFRCWWLVIIIAFTNAVTESGDENWMKECQSDANKVLTSANVCFKEFNKWIKLIGQHSTMDNNYNMKEVCPFSRTWISLLNCTCRKCHNTFLMTNNLAVIWSKYKCNMQNINATVDLCKWRKTVENVTEDPIKSNILTIQELQHVMSQAVVNLHRYKSIPTLQNIEEFFNLFKKIIDAIINLHLTTTKADTLTKWTKNITNNLEILRQTETEIKSEEDALLNGLKTIETKEHEMIEDLHILQQLENHFNIPRAQAETQEIFKKFKNFVYSVDQVHDEHTKKNFTSEKLHNFWKKGLNKLKMAANILSLIANETNSINKKLDEYQLSLNNVQNIQTKLNSDLHDERHELLLRDSKEFHDIIEEMRKLSKSQSYQNAITKMEQLSIEWKSGTQRIMKNIEIIEVNIKHSLQHIQQYNNSKQFSFDEEILVDHGSKPKLDIDGIFKEAWQEQMKNNMMNRNNVSTKYNDSLIEEDVELSEYYKSGSTDIMTNKLLTYGWTIIVGAVIVCFSFFIYLK